MGRIGGIVARPRKAEPVDIRNVAYYRVTDRISGKATIESMADMLRRDSAFYNPELPGVVAYPEFYSRRRGKWGGTVLHPRWASFGLKLSLLSPTEWDAAAEHWGADHQWFTFRNNSNNNLTRVSLVGYLRLAGQP